MNLRISLSTKQAISLHDHSRLFGDHMKKIITLAAALLIGAVGTAFAQKQEAPKPAAAPAAKAAAPAPAPTPAAAPAADAKKEPMDINTATDKELASLPKIGEAKAKAIIKGRPWGGKDDLVKKKVLSQAEYDAIKELIVAKQAKKEEAKKEAPKKDAKTK
jgi:competence protein ComEA